MADWLRPVFARAKTPVTGTDRQSSFSADDNNSEDGNMSRLRPTSRVSSYMGIRSSTPPIPQTPDTFTNIRNPERVYHKPSVDHMAETLKVVMMNQSSLVPVSIAYNSCILHVLEAYQDLRMELAKKEDFIESLKLSHTKDIKEFEALATQWEMKEKDYKTELKELEILLSKTEGGMEKVTLARSKSAVHGSGTAADTIGKGISTIKERNAGRKCRSRGNSDGTESSKEYKTAYSNVKAKQSFHPRVNPKPQLNVQAPLHTASTLGKRPSTSFRANDLQPRASSSSLHLYMSPTRMDKVQQPTPERPAPSLTRSQLDALEQQHEGDSSMTFDSSASGPESSTQSFHDEMAQVEKRLRRGLNIKQEHLPDIPSNPQPNKSGRVANDFCVNRYPQFDTSDEILETSPRLGFSFKPGDDIDIVAQNTVSNGDTNVVFGVSKYQLHFTTPEEQFGASYMSPQSIGEVRRPKSTPLNARPKLQTKPGIARDIQDNESLKRDDSTSSIITAIRDDSVRDNSGRNSVDSSRHSSRSVRQRLNRNSGCSEAVTAAVRALTGAPATGRSLAPRKKGTGSGTREGSSSGEGSPRTDEREEALSEQSQKTSFVRSGNGSPPQGSSRQVKRG